MCVCGGGATKREGGGGQLKSFTTTKVRGRGEKVLAMLQGGTTSFGVVLTQELEVLAILMGGGQKVSTL